MNILRSTCLLPPLSVRGMKVLEKSIFNKRVDTVALLVNEKEAFKVLKSLKKLVVSVRNFKPVQPWPNGKRAIVLDPCIVRDTDDALAKLKTIEQMAKVDYEIDEFSLELKYENWSADELIRAVLPEDVPSVTGFSIVGHIAHLNLKDAHAPYKSVIAQIILDNHKNLETVVNKTENIDNTYRNFQMELLAGKDDMNVTIKENKCSYKFNFSKVYWNSRLSTEHERIVEEITPNTVLYDVFAGVGPFSVPAAKKGSQVYANDLNPESFKYLTENLAINKVKGQYKTYNLDGKDFIQTVMKEDLMKHATDDRPIVIIMNLPALALQFLGYFVGLLQEFGPLTWNRKPPTVYCYSFSKVTDDSFERDVADRANTILMADVISPAMCRRVRNVAPNKEMMCIKFPLDSDILFRKQDDTAETVSAKRAKLELNLPDNL